ncbi:MAG: hypothetical protein ACM3JB_12385 [Acidobacteriaceae bacterium]
MPVRAFIVLSILLLLGCGAIGRGPENLFYEVSQSPDTGCHQGYATDGISHFLFDTHRILRRADDATWHITGVNDSPFEGLSGYDHIGDGDYFEGKLYAPAERYINCGTDHANPAIFIFDAETLVRRQVVPLQGTEEVSGIAVLQEARELWVSSYCDGSRIWVYDVDTFAFKRYVGLHPLLSAVQGLAYRAPYFYVAQNEGSLFRVTQEGETVRVFKTDSPGAHEGLDYSQKELRWLIDEGFGEQRVHYLFAK